MSKNCEIKTSWLERVLNIQRDTQIDRTTVFRNYDGKCTEVPINTYEILVTLNTSVTEKNMLKVSFTPQIEFKSRSLFMVSDFIYARFKGLFGQTAALKIRISGWNLFNPLKILTYVLPLAVVLGVVLILLYIIKFLFGSYTLNLTQQKDAQNTFTKLLLTYAKKDEKNLEIGLKNKVLEKETELQPRVQS